MKVFLLVSLQCFFIITNVYAQATPKKPYMLFEEAENAFRDNKPKEALSLLNECLKVDPGYMEAYSMRGSVREVMNDFDGALTDYSIFLEKFPDKSEVLLSRAALRYRLGFYEQAREDYLKLLTINPPTETNTILYRRGMSLGDRSPAITVSPAGQHLSHVYNNLGLTESKLKNYPQAKAYFDSAIRKNPNEPDYYVNRGLVREVLSDSTAAVDYENALKLNADHVLAKHNLAALQSKKKSTQSAEDRLSSTISSDSTMLYPYLERAQQRYEAEYYQGAVQDYSSALEIDSTDVEIWLGRGLAYEKMKNYKAAFSDYTRAIELKNDFAKAWLNRGNVLLKMERYEDAIEDYTVALLYWPDYPLAFYNRGMAKVKLKKTDEACADVSKAIELGMKVDAKVKAKICK
jgi:tetratricopeptide (TPR) repeat protein